MRLYLKETFIFRFHKPKTLKEKGFIESFGGKSQRKSVSKDLINVCASTGSNLSSPNGWT
jgi:hypothetical protein